MTISTTIATKRYDGDGATTAFPTSFKFLQNDHLVVVLRDVDGFESLWTENTQYTVTGAGSESGGTVTVQTSPVDFTPMVSETLVIRRRVPLSQETDYPEAGAFPAATHETALDLAAMRDQQLDEAVGRALHLPISDADGAITQIPRAETRAGRFLAFDGAGNPFASVGSSDGLGPVSPFMASVLDDSDQESALATLGVGPGWKRLVPTMDVTEASEVQFTLSGAFDGTFDILAFPFSNVVPSVDGEDLNAEIRAGFNWQQANYAIVRDTSNEGSATPTLAVGTAIPRLVVFSSCGMTAPGEVVSGCLFLHDPVKNDVRKIIAGHVAGKDNAGLLRGGAWRGMWDQNNAAINGFKFYMGTSGNTFRGNFGMYGLIKA